MPDRWQTVDRLLLLCFENWEAVLELQTAVRSLRQGFPATPMILLTTHESHVIQNHLPWLEVNSLQQWGIAHEPDRLSSSENTNQSCAFAPHSEALITAMRVRQFSAAIIFTTQGQSPFALAYLCYLAGIPLRLGQSQEFGGGVLSHTAQPSIDSISTANYYVQLVKAIGIQPVVQADGSSHLILQPEPSPSL
ncbi:hypothetical protein IQ268_17950 [Oculatella sp. LEGE 06141]|uniref:hypothetical protein n=1 Tax=Oculatella sp. LEGE 06141 TaxID=1828648 RepID=UPI00187E846B|nr:hypothetical protein [Oculatella sp. LEGE 06141]MBE9180447.1 hypothetical protein [Oculatella sp. LEGE 06141]